MRKIALQLPVLVVACLFVRDAQAAPAATAAPAPVTKPAVRPAPAAKPAATPAPAAAPVAAVAVDTAKFPAVVARVNGHELSKVELLNQAGTLLQQGQQPTMEFYKAVTDQMIGTRLLYDESVAQKLTATDADVDKAYLAVRGRFKGTDQEFAAKLKESGLTDATIKQGIRENLSIRNLVTTKIAPTVTVSDADQQKFYDDNPQRMQRPEQMQLSHILISYPPNATDADKAATKKKAEGILAKIKAGGDMTQLAKENSDDPGSKEQGGELGWISKGQTLPEFETAAFALKPGETSGLVDAEYGVHIIRAKDHRPAGKVSFAEAKEQIASFLHERAMSATLRDHVTALRAKAKVEVLLQ
ncbi:MAG: peptidylprolyl isomerase [Acidobacteriota bacterium]